MYAGLWFMQGSVAVVGWWNGGHATGFFFFFFFFFLRLPRDIGLLSSNWN